MGFEPPVDTSSGGVALPHQAWTSLPSASSSGSRCFRQQRDSTLNSISAMFNQLASGCSGTPAVSQSAGPPPPGKSRTATLGDGCSGCGRSSRRKTGTWPGRAIHQPSQSNGEVLHAAPLGHSTCRHPARGSQAEDRLCTSRRYSKSCKNRAPKNWEAVEGLRHNWVEVSSKQTTGKLWVHMVRVQAARPPSVGHEARLSPWGMHHALLLPGLEKQTPATPSWDRDRQPLQRLDPPGRRRVRGHGPPAWTAGQGVRWACPRPTCGAG